MANILTEPLSDFPEQIRAGDTVKVKRSDIGTDYPNSTFTAKFQARGLGQHSQTFSVTATADGSDYLFTFTATATASYPVDNYRFIITVESGSDRVTVDEGTIKILSDLPNANVEQRTHAQIVLDKIETLLQGKADSDVSSYSIAGRSLTKFGIDELLQWRDYYRREVNEIKKKERIKHNRKTKSTIIGRF